MGKTKQQKVKDFLINNGVIIVMFILVIYTGLTSNNFFTGNNLMNILMNMSSRLVIALGIAGCVITAGCDLSAGRMIGFGACISGMLLQRVIIFKWESCDQIQMLMDILMFLNFFHNFL